MMFAKRSGFSMLELIFVIVILGVLAVVAVPRFVTTRTDANVAMTRSDIATIFKQVSSRAFAENIQIGNTPPQGYSTWGDWLMDTPYLDKNRWKPTDHGLLALTVRNDEKGKFTAEVCEGEYLYIDLDTGLMYFIPKNIDTSLLFCKQLANSYSSNSNRIINLSTNDSVTF